MGGGCRGGAYLACGIHVHPLLHEALEGGEVARDDRGHLSLIIHTVRLWVGAVLERVGAEAQCQSHCVEMRRGDGAREPWLPPAIRVLARATHTNRRAYE